SRRGVSPTTAANSRAWASNGSAVSSKVMRQSLGTRAPVTRDGSGRGRAVTAKPPAGTTSRNPDRKEPEDYGYPNDLIPAERPRGRGRRAALVAADRRVRAARRLQLGRPRRPRRLDRLALPAALRQPSRLRADPRRGRRPLVAPARRRLRVGAR